MAEYDSDDNVFEGGDPDFWKKKPHKEEPPPEEYDKWEEKANRARQREREREIEQERAQREASLKRLAEKWSKCWPRIVSFRKKINEIIKPSPDATFLRTTLLGELYSCQEAMRFIRMKKITNADCNKFHKLLWNEKSKAHKRFCKGMRAGYEELHKKPEK